MNVEIIWFALLFAGCVIFLWIVSKLVDEQTRDDVLQWLEDHWWVVVAAIVIVLLVYALLF
jgi:uncharacterized membrane protein YdjX (TVP38/TMEM64 family)